jgi:hypothetical protein
MTRYIHAPGSRTTLATLFFLFALTPLLVLDAAEADYPPLPVPDAGLQPEDVVRIVIDSLANNDRPYADAGIAATYNFASPVNKANTGPIERFTNMVKAPPYGSMINHRSSELSEVVMQGNTAYLIVRLITIENAEVHFAFRLGLQSDGEFKGMWLTEAVWPLIKPADRGLKINGSV